MLTLCTLLRLYTTRPARFLAHDIDTTSFSQLVKRLRQTVGKGNEIEEIKSLISNYKPVSADYSKYVTWKPDKFTRNLIDQGNGLYNMMIMCWGPGHKAPIHSHPGANCFVRMLSGEIEEQLYTKPTLPGDKVILQQTRKLISGDVIHLRDDISIHSMSNVSNEGAITLHLYTPPYDTTEIFSEETAEIQSVPIVYTTKGGEYQPQPVGIGL